MANLILLLVCGFHFAHAQIQTEPIEIIDSVSNSSFTDRARNRPSARIESDDLKPSARPISETLNTIPGLQARDQGSPTFSIRGSGQADRTLKLFEGIPLNFADGLGALSIFIPEEAIGSLQLFKGPSSVYFGPSATAGALDHRTRLFERTALRGAVSDDTGLLGRRSFFAVQPYGRERNSQLTIFAESAPNRFRFDPSGHRRDNNGTDTLRSTFLGDYRLGEVKLRPVLLMGRQSGSLPGATYSLSPSSYNVNATLASIETSLPVQNKNTLSFRVADLRLWREDNDAFGTSTAANSRTLVNTDWLKEWNQLELRTFLDARTDSITASYLRSKQNQNFVEAGQIASVRFTPEWKAEAGYRYLANFGTIVTTAGLEHQVGRNKTWAVYSEGFRNPSLSDRYANFPGFQANPALEPETSHGGELGWRYESGRRYGNFLEGLAFGATAHITQYRNVFDTASVNPTTVTKINAGTARTSGLEVEVAYGVSVWTIGGAHSYLEAVNTDTGSHLRLAPKHQTALSVSTALGPAIMELKETIWSSTSDRDFAGATRELGSWQTLDFNVRTIALTDWEFRAGIFNVFDQPIELTYGYPEPQRRFYLSVLRSL